MATPNGRSRRTWAEKRFYEVLGVDETATGAQIKKAYRRLALERHPDTATGSDEHFKALAEAHAVLSDPVERAMYDAVRRRPPPPSPPVPPPPTKPEPVAGKNCYLSVEGTPGCFYEVAEFVGPVDGLPVELPARQIPGRYVFAGRGYASRTGGPPGDLVVDYHWPGPIRGADVHHPLELSRKERRRGVSFRSPTTGYELTLPGAEGEDPVVFPGQGLAGEFGGSRGDLIVDLGIKPAERRLAALWAR